MVRLLIPIDTSWCVASSPLVKAALGLLGPTCAVWFFQVWRAKAHSSAAYQAGKAGQYAGRAKKLLIALGAFWVLTALLYTAAFVNAKGKECDANLSSCAALIVALFVWSLAPLVFFLCLVAYDYLQYLRYNEQAKARKEE
jgi:hypothetical protein